jgi:hypothetical protein
VTIVLLSAIECIAENEPNPVEEHLQTSSGNLTTISGLTRQIGTCFVENRGQTSSIVKYYQIGNPTVAFRDDGVMFLAKPRSREPGQDESRFPNTIDRDSANIYHHDEAKSLAYTMRFDGANRDGPDVAHDEFLLRQ